ncbi:MAG: 4-hydroxy-tetrahydrodipicolinate synthase [Alphaproteobacteria bacterium]|nr:4-hydroxy-tetrahydrodipicolinate synthase [Alphaproteobacteria bacterium]
MLKSSKFTGIFTALITPLCSGEVDEKAFQSFVEWQVSEGVNGLVPCGTTGESPTLSHDEHRRVIELCVEASAGKVPVMAGSGSNSTDEAIELTQHAQTAGADAALVVTPYYNKPSQEGLYQHFKSVAESVDIPIFIYNIPGRSVVNISDETLMRLAKLSNIMGVKDATGDLCRPLTLRWAGGKNLVQLSGEDMTAVSFNASGGVGCISVTSNVAPKLCAEVQAACLAGDYKTALEKHEKLVPLHLALFSETSPAPVKQAVNLLGKCSSEVRLPLVRATQQCEAHLHKVMQDLGMV